MVQGKSIKPYPVPSPPEAPWDKGAMDDKQFIEKKLGLEYPPQHVMENALAYMKGTEELKPHGEGCKDCAPNNDGLSKKRGKHMDQATHDTDEAVDFTLLEFGLDSEGFEGWLYSDIEQTLVDFGFNPGLHPRWPKGSPDHLSGRFMPKSGLGSAKLNDHLKHHGVSQGDLKDTHKAAVKKAAGGEKSGKNPSPLNNFDNNKLSSGDRATFNPRGTGSTNDFYGLNKGEEIKILGKSPVKVVDPNKEDWKGDPLYGTAYKQVPGYEVEGAHNHKTKVPSSLLDPPKDLGSVVNSEDQMAIDLALQKGDIVEWGSDSGEGAKAYGIVREVDEVNQQASVQPLMLGPQDMLVRAGEKALMKDLDVLSSSSKKLTESIQWPTKANENAVMGMFLAKDTGEGIKPTVMDLAEGNQLSEEQYAELADFFDETDDGYGGWTCDYADFQQHGGLEMRGWLEEVADLTAGLSPGDPVTFKDKTGQSASGKIVSIKGGIAVVRLNSGGTTTVPVAALSEARSSDMSDEVDDDENLLPIAEFASSGGSNTTSAAKTKNVSLNFDESQIQSALKDAPSGFDTTENRQAVLNIVTHAASTGNFGTNATQGMDAASAAAAKQAAASLIESTGGAVARDANGNPTTVTKSPQGDSTSSGSGSGSSSGSGSGSKGSGSGSGGSTPKGSSSGSGGGSKGSGSGGSGGGKGGGSGTGGGKGSGKAATPTGPIDPSHPHAPAGQPNGGQFIKKDGSGNTTDTQGADETLNAALEGLDPALDTPENRAALTDAMKGAVNGDLSSAQDAINKIPEGQRADAVQAMGTGLEKLGYKVNRDSSGVPTSVVKKGNETLNTSIVDLTSVSSRPWSDFSKADYSPEQWQKACLAPDADGGKLPVLEPSGAINKNALSAAAGALNGARGGVNLAPDQHAKAKSKLKRLYSQVGMDAPADLADTPDFAVGDKVSFTDEDGNTVTGEITELKDEGEDDGPEAVVELDESGEEIEIGLDKLTKANDTGSNLASTMTRKASEIAKGHKIMLGAQPHHVTSVRKRGNRVHIKVKGKSKSYSYNADNPVVIPADSGAAMMSDNPFSDIVNFAADVGMDIAQLPLDLAQAQRVSGNIWEKQILPFQKINYKGRILDFSRKFGEALVNNFNKRPFDQVKVFKVDSENRHNSDPENVRGEVNSLKLKDDGVYATVKTNEQGTKHLKEVDPKVGSSVRVRFNWKRPSDNKYFGPVLEHLALTTLPHVPGLNTFVPADLSLTDLSEEEGGATRVAGGVEDMTALSFEVPGMEGGEDPVEDVNANTTTVEKEVSDLSDQEIRDLDLSQFEEGQQEAIRKLMEKADLAEQSFEGWQRERQARHEERVDAFIDESNRRGVAPAVTGIARPILMDMSLMEQTLSVDLSDDGSAAQETNVHDALRDIIKNFPSSVEYGKRGAADLTEDEGDDDDAVYETVKYMFVEGGE